VNSKALVKPTSNVRPKTTIAVATGATWGDVLEVFKGSGDRDCWCQYWRQSSTNYSQRVMGPGKAVLQRQVKEGPPPGLIAYIDDKPIGWLGFWPRQRLERLVRSRTIPKIDEQEVWSIVCFMIRVGNRRKGVAKALLGAAVEFARKNGVSILEAYPIDPEGKRVDVAFAYVGLTPMFEAVGFRRVLQTDARSAGRPRVLMRLEISPTHIQKRKTK
jgi:GNAT superfamily N-acetyltransferase